MISHEGKYFPSLIQWIAFRLLTDLGCMETKQTPQTHRSWSFWRLQSTPPQRTRTVPRINFYFIGHQFKVTQSDSFGCRGRFGGPRNEIHAASPNPKPALTSWVYLTSALTHTFAIERRLNWRCFLLCWMWGSQVLFCFIVDCFNLKQEQF